MPLLDRLSIAAQALLPQRTLSTAMHHFMASEANWLKTIQINTFLRLFDLNMAEAVEPDPHAYPSFNAFFTRALKPDARPLDARPSALLSPADGTVGACGRIESGMAYQAKGRSYSLESLLAGSSEEGASFNGGHYATIYLAPFNYHRVHTPLGGRLIETRYVPGRLFNVRPATVQGLDGLYARNERTVSLFETDFGRLAVVMVGALFVGSVSHSWQGKVMPPRGLGRQRWPDDGSSPDVTVARGEEIGWFNMGSTVVLAVEHGGDAPWLVEPGSAVNVGEALRLL